MQGAHYQNFIPMAAIVNVMDNTWIDISNMQMILIVIFNTIRLNKKCKKCLHGCDDYGLKPTAFITPIFNTLSLLIVTLI